MILDAAARRDERQAWLAASYVIPAYHQPDKFPDIPTLRPEPSQPAEGETSKMEADSIAARAIMKAWADRSANG